MAHFVKGLVIKPKHLSLIPTPLVVDDEEKPQNFFSDFHMCAMACIYTHKYNLKNEKN